jgi:hypothetical protein
LNLTQLGNEYLEQEKRLRQRIKQLRPQLKTLRGDDHRLMVARLQSLYYMALDCRVTGLYLKNYYEGENGRGTQNYPS